MMAQELRDESVFSYTPQNGVLDGPNLSILRELRANPRLPMAELARRIGMSAPTVTERTRRLEDARVIQGYRLDLNPTPLGLPITAFVRVRPNPGQLSRIAELAERIPEVVECHRVTGDDCFILKVHIPAMEQLDRLLDRFLFFGTTTTSIVQSSPVPLRPAPLPSAADHTAK